MLSSMRHARRSSLAAAATLLIGLAFAGPRAGAEGIPQSALDNDLKSCVAACVGRGKPPEKCSAACDCTTKAYGEQLTIEEYLAINNAVEKNEEPPKAALDKMKAITQTCKAKME